MPAEVYWRRRLLVLAALLLLIWIVVQVVEDDPRSASQQAPAVVPSAAPTPASGGGPVPASFAKATKKCLPEKVRIEPTVTSGQRTQTPVDMSFLLTTAQKESCLFDAAAADLLVVINANGSAIWDSSVCKEAILAEPVTIPATWGTAVAATWSGRGSGSSCSKKESFGSPGAYVIKVATLGGEPGKDEFTLTSPPEPEKATPTNDPETKPKPKPKNGESDEQKPASN